MSESRDPAQDQLQLVIKLYMEDKLDQALMQISQLLQRFPDSSILYNILGATYVRLEKLDAAIASYKQALKINPDDAKTYYNLGIACGEQGNSPAAIDSFKQALRIAPDYALAYNGLGNALKDEGDLAQAIFSYKQAVKISPDFAEVYNNLGTAFKAIGDLEQAISSFQQALEFKPDYAEAYNNMGVVLRDKGNLRQAIISYAQALKINPDYADAAWNLVGTAGNIDDAEEMVKRCLAVDQNYLDAKLTLSILECFKGDRKNFDELMKSSIKEHPIMRSMAWVSGLPELPELHFHRWAFFDSIMGRCIQDRPFYEFGVFTGEAFKYLIKTFRKGFGFDTFEGLPEDWHLEKAGSYSSGGNVPEIVGGEFIVGKFEETLPSFFAVPRPVASVINFDADLYSSTICALNFSRSIIDSHTVLIFDEFIVNEHWEQDEFRALNEFCSAGHYTFEVLAISFFTKQVAVRLVDI